MRGTMTTLAAAVLASACAAERPPPSPERSCVIVGGPRAPVIVRIYESDPYASPAGSRLFIGLLNFNERQVIQSRDGHIWYAFKWHEGDSWREGFEAPCRDGAVVSMP